MGDVATYKIVNSGEFLAGFDPAQVKRTFAVLFNLPVEKAQAALERRCVLKKGLVKDKADIYKKRLEVIGLNIRIEPEITGLTLQPLDVEAIPSSAAEPDTNLVACPKCMLEQPLAELCCGCGCGMYMHKLNAAHNTVQSESRFDTKSEKNQYSKVSKKLTDEQAGAAIYFPALIAALLGACLWIFISLALNFELGIIAWVIGGLIGFAAAKSGGRGEMSGIVCGLFALVAIAGGKYCVTYYAHKEFVSTVAAAYAEADLKPLYEAEQHNAKRYLATVVDEPSLKQFMVFYGYGLAVNISGLTQEEITYFKTYTAPLLKQLAVGGLSMSEWAKASLSANVEQVSTLEMLIADLGFIDWVWLFLGVGTAYRLGRGDS